VLVLLMQVIGEKSGAELSSKKENVFKSLNNDINLINAINKFKDDLKRNNIEIFEEKDNILITENGYYLAIFPEAIKEVIE